MADLLPDSPDGSRRPADDVVVQERAERVHPGTRSGPAGTPLIVSRSLGRLLGLGPLLFKVECWPSTGSWLDRSAAAVVTAAIAEGRTGLCAVGVGDWAVSLAIQCARAGLRFVLLEPTIGADASGGVVQTRSVGVEARGWLSALGARTLAVEASLQTLHAVAPLMATDVGLRAVAVDDPLLQVGFGSLVSEVEQAGYADPLLAVPCIAGRESWAWG